MDAGMVGRALVRTAGKRSQRQARAWALVKRAAGPAVAILIIANFAGYAMLGPHGLLAWGEYDRSLEVRRTELARLEATRDRLRHRADLLDPRSADPDLADELVRRELGVVRPDEVVVNLD